MGKDEYHDHAPDHTEITYCVSVPRDEGPGYVNAFLKLQWSDLSDETKQALMADVERKRRSQ